MCSPRGLPTPVVALALAGCALVCADPARAAPAPAGAWAPMAPRRMLLHEWDETFQRAVESMAAEGLEGAILRPLARYPRAALAVVEHLRRSDDHARRKTAAMIAGALGAAAPPALLDDLLEAERARDRAGASERERLEAQAVVEEVVFAATRWCREPRRRQAGLGVLRKVVERTLAGEYWNTASYAMAGLVHHAPARSRELLARFTAFAHGTPPAHPSRPSLAQERTFAEALAAGRSDQIERLLSQADEAAAAHPWAPEERDELEELLGIARQVR